MYSKNSLFKVIALLTAAHAVISEMKLSDIKMCISTGNQKIGRVMNVSLPPIITCNNCKECKHYCYDVKACLQYPNTVINARARNYEILIKNRDEYFRRIDLAMSRRRKNKFFRWHVAGEIIDYDYFDRMINNARLHSDFVIWTYTKNYTVVNEWIRTNGKNSIPANLHIMFSEWDGMPIDNPYGMPIFTVKMTAGNKNHAPEFFNGLYKCPGNCDICKKLRRGCLIGEDTFADEH